MIRVLVRGQTFWKPHPFLPSHTHSEAHSAGPRVARPLVRKELASYRLCSEKGVSMETLETVETPLDLPLHSVH
jgi:hypothetical protein